LIHSLSPLGMLAGAVIWLTFELLSVFTRGRTGETTTHFVRLGERKYWWARILVAFFVTWLGGHFLLGWGP